MIIPKTQTLISLAVYPVMSISTIKVEVGYNPYEVYYQGELIGTLSSHHKGIRRNLFYTKEELVDHLAKGLEHWNRELANINARIDIQHNLIKMAQEFTV